MKMQLLMWLLLAATTTRCQGFSVISHPDHAEIVSSKFGYRFDAPKHWYASEGNPVPYVFSYNPKLMAASRVLVPTGSAEVSVVEDKGTYNSGSIDKWMQIERGRGGVVSVRDVNSRVSRSISRAVEVVSYEDVGDSEREVAIHKTAVYFSFEGRVFAAIMRFNANDPHARQYEGSLYGVLLSFRKASEGGR